MGNKRHQISLAPVGSLTALWGGTDREPPAESAAQQLKCLGFRKQVPPRNQHIIPTAAPSAKSSPASPVLGCFTLALGDGAAEPREIGSKAAQRTIKEWSKPPRFHKRCLATPPVKIQRENAVCLPLPGAGIFSIQSCGGTCGSRVGWLD